MRLMGLPMEPGWYPIEGKSGWRREWNGTAWIGSEHPQPSTAPMVQIDPVQFDRLMAKVDRMESMMSWVFAVLCLAGIGLVVAVVLQIASTSG